jgi:hypothetical protein
VKRGGSAANFRGAAYLACIVNLHMEPSKASGAPLIRGLVSELLELLEPQRASLLGGRDNVRGQVGGEAGV